jgi:MipA family protein
MRALTISHLACLGFLAAAFSAPALAQEAPRPWRGSLGLAAQFGPDYLGASRQQLRVRPLVALRYQGFGFSTGGAGALGGFDAPSVPAGLSWSYAPSESLRLGLGLRAEPGRRESANPRLSGMGDTRSTLRANLFASYRLNDAWALSAAVQPDLLGRDAGVALTLGAAYTRRLGADWLAVGALSLQGGDRAALEREFGVSTAQSASSGLPAYAPGAGLRNLSVSVGLNHRIAKNWTGFGRVQLGRVVGDAARSPLVQEATQAGVTFGAGYRF